MQVRTAVADLELHLEELRQPDRREPAQRALALDFAHLRGLADGDAWRRERVDEAATMLPTALANARVIRGVAQTLRESDLDVQRERVSRERRHHLVYGL